ncbi:hypothetical protein ROZALSC1DRAFT_26718 [Rozella allomycis CSF55]|uniref:Uncharacterized protein n=1 Tax=Rozella allomycis (strain CSF55) TaxID=988480 RepID=A0A075AQ24_ROZAC|nr:hypothetical protein O9G_003070 [Rozella allomycis CSF55]RKP21887.1 hypothetical protein ROZALSC1DRAFT_26718 [Rozella allomycis CSF55]|eukprot:EPZ30835.1 hypothetical protein O9G_003070 [Rozella allomycis CSF55]
MDSVAVQSLEDIRTLLENQKEKHKLLESQYTKAHETFTELRTNSLSELKQINKSLSLLHDKKQEWIESYKDFKEQVRDMTEIEETIRELQKWVWLERYLEAHICLGKITKEIGDDFTMPMKKPFSSRMEVLRRLIKVVKSINDLKYSEQLKAQGNKMLNDFDRLIRTEISSSFMEITQKIGWPRIDSEFNESNEVIEEMKKLVKDSIEFQKIMEREITLAIDVMIEPIRKRFKFHFDGKKMTNRLDKVKNALNPFLA